MNLEERRAAEGSVVAKSVLGLRYLDGIDVPPDHARALSLLTEAASRGASRAMLGLGRMYDGGLATVVDLD